MNEFYIYKWYIKSTDEVFYVGKGKGNRFSDVIHSRNSLFKNIINKHKGDVEVSFLYENLSEDAAFQIERDTIKKFWEIGQCRANFHEGGHGGNTGKYDDPERSRKLSEKAKLRVGHLNPMFGRTHSYEVRKRLSEVNMGKHLSEEHKRKLIEANTGRKLTKEQKEHLSAINKGKKLSDEAYKKMMSGVCKYEYEVFLNGDKIYVCLGHTALYRFCKNTLKISRTIADSVINNTWKCKFNRHKHLQTLVINKIPRGVTTNGDECSRVG